jgi:hypothetical protein
MHTAKQYITSRSSIISGNLYRLQYKYFIEGDISPCAFTEAENKELDVSRFGGHLERDNIL